VQMDALRKKDRREWKIGNDTISVYSLDTVFKPSRQDHPEWKSFMPISEDIEPADAIQWQRDPSTRPRIKMCNACNRLHLLPVYIIDTI